MNPVFWILVVVVAIILWFLLAFIFYPFYRIISDAVSELNREEEGKEGNKK